MVSPYLFPTSASQREEASTAPVRFFLGQLLSLAATMALMLAVVDVVWPENTFANQPGKRLYLIVTSALLMAAATLWAARRFRR